MLCEWSIFLPFPFLSLPYFFSPDGHGQFKASYTEKKKYFLNVTLIYICMYKIVLCIKTAKPPPYLWIICNPTQKEFHSFGCRCLNSGSTTRALPSQQHHSRQRGTPEHSGISPAVREDGGTRPLQYCLQLWDRRWEITQAGEKHHGKGHGIKLRLLH